MLPEAIGPLSDKLSGHDLAIVVGAPASATTPMCRDRISPSAKALLHVTDDPDSSAKAPVGDSLVADSLLFLEQIVPLVQRTSGLAASQRHVVPSRAGPHAPPAYGPTRSSG